MQHALDARNEALVLAPDNVDLLVDRAFSYRDKNDFRSAIGDLDRAHELAPERADVLTYRASAWRFLKDNKRRWPMPTRPWGSIRTMRRRCWSAATSNV